MTDTFEQASAAVKLKRRQEDALKKLKKCRCEIDEAIKLIEDIGTI
jgi:hypothetical protein